MAEYRFKILLLGSPAVGKTSILHKFVKNTFAHNYATTIGMNFLTKDLKFTKKDKAKLVVWDFAGQKRFKSLQKDFYKAGNGALLIFDLTRAETFDDIDEWRSGIAEVLQNDIPFILIGNKMDLIEELGRGIEADDSREYAEGKGSIYIETSAKTGENIENAFIQLTRIMAGEGLIEKKKKQKKKKKKKRRRKKKS